MNNIVYSPIDMDGIPWTGDIANCIQELSLTFSGVGGDYTGDLKRGETILSEFYFNDNSDWGFDVTAVHPLTGKVYTANVSDGGRSIRYPSTIGFSIGANIISDHAFSLSTVRVFPTAVSFLAEKVKDNVFVYIPTVHPIVSTIFGKKVTIDIEDNLSNYSYRQVEDTGLKRINGVVPVNGNIDIVGVGQTIINVGQKI